MNQEHCIISNQGNVLLKNGDFWSLLRVVLPHHLMEGQISIWDEAIADKLINGKLSYYNIIIIIIHSSTRKEKGGRKKPPLRV